MAVEVGSAVGYLDLDISGFMEGLRTANSEAGLTAQNMEKTLSEKFKSAGDKISSVGGTLTKTVSLPLVGIGAAGLKVATDFEKGMSEVKAISGATGEDFNALRDKAIDLGASTAFSAGEVANAMTEMAKAGWNTDQIIGGMGGVLDAAAASGENLGTVSTIVADAITGFGLEARDSSRVADLLTQAANSGTIGINDLGESFKYVAPVAGSLGMSIEDCTTAIAAMSMAGIKGSQAGTSLRTIMTNLIKPTDQMQTAMDELGISVLDSQGNMKSLDGIIANLRTSFDGLTEAEKAQYAATLAGKEGMSGLLAILNLSEEEYNELAASMDGCKDVAKNTAEVMQDNLQSKVEQLMGSLESLAIVLADNIIPALTNFVEWLTGVIEKFTQMDPATQKFVLGLAGILIAIGPILSVVGKLTSGIGSVIGIFEKFGGAASKTAGPVTSAGTAMGGMAKTAMSMLGAGAGILLAATGLALLAQSSIALANAGWPAIACMVGMTAALAGLAFGASVIAPALTAGAVGLIAFGGAVALVGVGVLAASAGVALLATQLPVISEYGAQAAINILNLGGAMTVFGAGALVAGAGAVVLGAGLVAVGVGATGAAVGVTLLGAGVLVLAAGAITLGAGLVVCGAGLTLMAATAGTAAAGMSALAVAATAAFIPIAGGAVSGAALAVALGGLAISAGLASAALLLAAGSCALLATAMESTATSVKSIEESAGSAAQSLEDMVTSVDVVKAGLDGLGTIASDAINAFVNIFTSAGPTASAAALAMATGVTNSMNTGLMPIPMNTTMVMTQTNAVVTTSMTQISTTVVTHSNMSAMAVQMCMTQINAATTAGMAQMNATIRSGFGSAVSYIKSLAGQAYGWGADIMQGLINGINSRMGALSAAVNRAANIIYSRLHFSRPDEGPLRDYETWMPDFMEGLAKGINDNSYLVKSAVQDVASDMKLDDVEAYKTELFTNGDTEKLKTYNVTLINTIGLYKQLVEQMRMCSEYSGIMSGDNGLLNSVITRVEERIPEKPANEDRKEERNKPDTLTIPISIGEEQIENVVVDLLRREVRV